jgi:N6-adenosine-specific RNA methylase IME4
VVYSGYWKELILVGSNSWLAKGHWLTDGSMVVIHENGNESIGVRDFINLLKDQRAEVFSKCWELYDLRESLNDDLSK